eukprot:1156221-Pelagomonas_calceolata.AAC.10
MQLGEIAPAPVAPHRKAPVLNHFRHIQPILSWGTLGQAPHILMSNLKIATQCKQLDALVVHGRSEESTAACHSLVAIHGIKKVTEGYRKKKASSQNG